MDSSYESSIGDLSISRDSYTKGNISISGLDGFERLRISALRNAAVISPHVKEATIGPNSPIKKEIMIAKTPNQEKYTKEENLFEDRLQDDLRCVLLRKRYERCLSARSDEHYMNLIEQMTAKQAEVMTKFGQRQSEMCKRRTLEVKARKYQMLKELQENDNYSILEKAKLDAQKSQMIHSQTMENMNKILEEQNKATARFASITDSQTKICMCYNEISNLINTEPLAKNICDKYMNTITTVMINIELVLNVLKTGTVTDKEVKHCEVLSLNMENVKKKILEEIAAEGEKIKQEELLRKQKEEQLAREKELQALKVDEQKSQQITQVQKAPSEAKKVAPIFYSPKNYGYYTGLKKYLEEYEAQYKELLDNPNLKKFRFDCQKAVNTPVNALSSVSGSHMRDKFNKLYKLLSGERVQVLDTFVQVTDHPQGLAYCTALLAKKIVTQGDLLVSSNPEAAFPLAAVTVALWAHFPKFGVLLEANFQKYCPYLVPMFLPQKEGQTDKEFYLSRGYTYNEEGMVEKQDKFLRRMSGIFKLRCAIWIAKMPQFLNAPNPHSLKFGWQWLASFINLKPEPDICATLLHDFFNMCGSECFRHYGKQFIKIIRLISTQYLAILQNIDEGGPKTRLEVFLQNVLKTGHIPPPSGLLPPNTW